MIIQQAKKEKYEEGMVGDRTCIAAQPMATGSPPVLPLAGFGTVTLRPATSAKVRPVVVAHPAEHARLGKQEMKKQKGK